MTIRDQLGRVMDRHTIDVSSDEISLKGIAAGVYYLSLSLPNGIEIIPFVVR